LGGVENKLPVVRGRRAKEGVQVYQDLCRERGGAGGMVDSQPGIIRENEGVGSEGFGTVRAPLAQTPNPCPKALFIVEDEHDILPPTSELLLEPKRSTVQCKKWSGG
jgi:hypothetical protein